jgi:hypothetical protein
MPGLIEAKQMYIVIAMAKQPSTLANLHPQKDPLSFRCF